MKAKWLSFAFIYFLLFFGIGTFQRVTGEKIKKFPLSPTRLSGCAQSALALLSPGRTARVTRGAGSRVFLTGNHSVDFCFVQDNVANS
jgi:hypothetical protein